VEILVAATEIEWGEPEGTASLPPDSVTIVGNGMFWAKLVPYASSKLHMGELPVVSLEKLNMPV